MEYRFEVGKVYRNYHGCYEILSIAEPEMRVGYEDGRVGMFGVWHGEMDGVERDLGPLPTG